MSGQKKWAKEFEIGLSEKVKGTYEKKINKELKKAIEEKPDSELSELANLFNCTIQAVFNALKRMKISRKKRHLLILKSQIKNEQNIFKK